MSERATVEQLEQLQALVLQHLIRELSNGEPPSAALLGVCVKFLGDNEDAIAAANVAKRRELVQLFPGASTLPFKVPMGEA